MPRTRQPRGLQAPGRQPAHPTAELIWLPRPAINSLPRDPSSTHNSSPLLYKPPRTRNRAPGALLPSFWQWNCRHLNRSVQAFQATPLQLAASGSPHSHRKAPPALQFVPGGSAHAHRQSPSPSFATASAPLPTDLPDDRILLYRVRLVAVVTPVLGSRRTVAGSAGNQPPTPPLSRTRARARGLGQTCQAGPVCRPLVVPRRWRIPPLCVFPAGKRLLAEAFSALASAQYCNGLTQWSSSSRSNFGTVQTSKHSAIFLFPEKFGQGPGCKYSFCRNTPDIQTSISFQP